MPRLPIVTIPHPILRQRAKDITAAELQKPTVQKFIDSMIETMYAADGVGLAAPQVGVGQRIIVVSTKDGEVVYINPTITKYSFRKENMEEGCLSIPGVFGIVRRSKHVTLQALDRYGQPLRIRAEGFFARIIQHEVDHVDGTLFTQRVLRYTKGEQPVID